MDLKQTLGDFVDLLRAKGVVEYQGPLEWGPLEHPAARDRASVHLKLGLSLPAPATIEEQPKRDEPRRDDGLTAREAEDLYWSSGG